MAEACCASGGGVRGSMKLSYPLNLVSSVIAVNHQYFSHRTRTHQLIREVSEAEMTAT